MITHKQAKMEIEKYFDCCGYDKSLITEDTVESFVEMCNDDYEEWVKNMLNSYFNDNGQKFEHTEFFFEK